VTGPIASGKDTFIGMLKTRETKVIDADKIGHEILRNNASVRREIADEFGSQVLSKKGAIDRKKLGKQVFHDRHNLKKLERLLHPLMKKAILREIKSSGKRVTVVNAALLREIGLLPEMDVVISVIASKKNRLARLMKKTNRRQAMNKMASQRGLRSYIDEADIVIRNDSGLRELKDKVTLLSRSVLRL
jgi:dephospho-CoA kinase